MLDLFLKLTELQDPDPNLDYHSSIIIHYNIITIYLHIIHMKKFIITMLIHNGER